MRTSMASLRLLTGRGPGLLPSMNMFTNRESRRRLTGQEAGLSGGVRTSADLFLLDKNP